MTRLASSTKLSRRSNEEPLPSVIYVRLQPEVPRAKVPGVPQPNLARAKEIFVPSGAWLPVDRKTKRAIDRIVGRWAPAVALRIVELSLATTMTSLQDGCDERQNRKPIPSSKKSSGKNTKTTNVTPRAGNAGHERI